MPHLTYFAAISLDGRLAGAGDDLAFLGTLDGGFRGTEYDMDRLIAGFDSLVMGAATFRVIRERIAAGLHPQWPYGDRPSWIVTHAAELAPVPGPSALRRFAGHARELLAEVVASGARRTWLVGGGDLAAQLLAIDGVDELILAVAPAILGRGPALADGHMPLRHFRLEDVARDGSALALRYRRAGQAPRPSSGRTASSPGPMPSPREKGPGPFLSIVKLAAARQTLRGSGGDGSPAGMIAAARRRRGLGDRA